VAAVVHADLLAGDALTRTRADRSAVTDLVRQRWPLMPLDVVAEAVDAVMARAYGLGVLEVPLGDPAVDEVMVNGDGSVWVEVGGRVRRTALSVTTHEALGIAERVLAPLGLRVDPRHPVADARLADGSRLHVVVPPVAVDGPVITIRRFGVRAVPLDAFCDRPVAELLARAVRARANIIVSGGTGAGKTTLLNALAGVLRPNERIVTIEDTAELRLPGEHVVRLEARPAVDDVPGVGIGDLVRTALRMRPDRIIVGEVRGPEVLDMLVAMNTGHAGSLCSVHANSPPDALRRLEALAVGAGHALPLEAVREHLVAALDLVVQVTRTSTGGRRVVAVDQVVAVGGRPTTRSWVRGDEIVGGPTAATPLPAATP
jgi:pilus assembly protein CpaF